MASDPEASSVARGWWALRLFCPRDCRHWQPRTCHVVCECPEDEALYYCPGIGLYSTVTIDIQNYDVSVTQIEWVWAIK